MAKKGIDKKKIVLVALGVGAVGTLAFFAIHKVKSGDAESNGSNASGNAEITADPAPKKKILSLTKKRNKLLPAAKGSAAPVSYEPFVPGDIAQGLKDAGEAKDLAKTLSLLQKIKNRADYLLVDLKYEHLRYWGNKSIVSDLLTVFFTSEADKQKIRNEFLRMGLVQDKVTGKWSVPQNLTGLTPYRDIITLVKTYVVDKKGNRIPVKKSTILGEEISMANGMTCFKAIDGSTGWVPAKDVRYA